MPAAAQEFDPARASELLSNATYLDNCVVEVSGLWILGIPWKRQFAASKVVKALGHRLGGAPPLDIVVAHEPPAGTLDGG